MSSEYEMDRHERDYHSMQAHEAYDRAHGIDEASRNHDSILANLTEETLFAGGRLLSVTADDLECLAAAIDARANADECGLVRISKAALWRVMSDFWQMRAQLQRRHVDDGREKVPF